MKVEQIELAIQELLKQIADLHAVPEGSYNIRKNGESVAKARLAAEEIYKIKMPRRRGNSKE